MIMMTQITRTTAPPPAAPTIIITPLSASPFLCAFLFARPSAGAAAAEVDGTVVLEEHCASEKKD